MLIADPNMPFRAFLYMATKALALVVLMLAAKGLLNGNYSAFFLMLSCSTLLFCFWRIYLAMVKPLTGVVPAYNPAILKDHAIELALSRNGKIFRRTAVAIGFICWGLAAATEYRYAEWVILELFTFAMYLVMGFYSLRKLPEAPRNDQPA